MGRGGFGFTPRSPNDSPNGFDQRKKRGEAEQINANQR